MPGKPEPCCGVDVISAWICVQSDFCRNRCECLGAGCAYFSALCGSLNIPLDRLPGWECVRRDADAFCSSGYADLGIGGRTADAPVELGRRLSNIAAGVGKLPGKVDRGPGIDV